MDDVCCTTGTTVMNIKVAVRFSLNMSPYRDISLVCENGTKMKPLCACVRDFVFGSNLEVRENKCTVTLVILHDRYFCEVCNRPCIGRTQFADHLAGKNHSKMMRTGRALAAARGEFFGAYNEC